MDRRTKKLMSDLSSWIMEGKSKDLHWARHAHQVIDNYNKEHGIKPKR